jgi:type IV pilus assembly protein PilA
MTNKKLAFTLVEMIVTLSIIGVLISISAYTFSIFRKNARDAQRVSDVTQIQNALATYYRDNHTYPDTLSFGSTLRGPTSSAYERTSYIEVVPRNPLISGKCTDTEYKYIVNVNNTSTYLLEFCLNSQMGDIGPGYNCVTAQGISSGHCCPDYVTYTGGSHNGKYQTVFIDENGGHNKTLPGQCWFKESLNIGTQINAGAPVADNGIVEKYCPSDIAANCLTYTPLYNYNEAMNYVDDSQGICPLGWHIPSNDEWFWLLDILTTQSCVSTWDIATCSGSGPKMNIGGSSGFNIIFSGYGNNSTASSSYLYIGDRTNFWSSTGYANVTTFYSSSSSPLVYRFSGGNSAGMRQVRCLRD